MARYRTTIRTKNREAMLDLVRKHKIQVFDHGNRYTPEDIAPVPRTPHRTGDHLQGQLRLGREVYIGGDTGHRTPLRDISPAARQVKPAVDQRPRSMAWAIPAGEDGGTVSAACHPQLRCDCRTADCHP